MDDRILDLIYINRLKENTWFSMLPETFQNFILEHGKQITFEKIAMFSTLKIYLMAFIPYLKAQLAWVMSM